jgi:hypothetical protein
MQMRVTETLPLRALPNRGRAPTESLQLCLHLFGYVQRHSITKYHLLSIVFESNHLNCARLRRQPLARFQFASVHSPPLAFYAALMFCRSSPDGRSKTNMTPQKKLGKSGIVVKVARKDIACSVLVRAPPRVRARTPQLRARPRAGYSVKIPRLPWPLPV